MGSITVKVAEDLPYGPGNPDYEYDGRHDEAPKPQRGSADADGPPALSASIAHLLITKSALHAWHAHPRLNPNYQQTESAEFDYGRAAHAVLLEGDESRLHVIEADDWRKKDAKEARENARKAGKMPLLSRQIHKVRAMAKVAKEHVADSELAGIFEAGEPEKSLHWEEVGIHCRARLDWLSTDRKLILDYKTSQNANPDAFIRGPLTNYGYDTQGAFYLRGNAATGGSAHAKYVWLVQEVEPPYVCSLVGMGPQMQEIAERKVDWARAIWQRCIQTGQWPAYPNRIAWAELPEWSVARFEELLETGEQA